MEDLFKKVLYTGVGLVTNTSESIKKGIDELVNKGKLSEDEGQKVVSNLQKNLETKREEFEAGINNVVAVAMEKLNLPTADAIKSLEKRIKSLEIKVGLLSKELETTKDGEEGKKTAKGRTSKAEAN
ncbi:MAG TPA: phasin family protein [Saprospiraceae bacterium]|nr:phasin family protein [Saprospiraceae bacterium]HMQ85063.1 phasin family protein [Saprospiraceae bacterium]